MSQWLRAHYRLTDDARHLSPLEVARVNQALLRLTDAASDRQPSAPMSREVPPIAAA